MLALSPLRPPTTAVPYGTRCFAWAAPCNCSCRIQHSLQTLQTKPPPGASFRVWPRPPSSPPWGADGGVKPLFEDISFPEHKAALSCAWVHLFRRDHSAGKQASPSRFIALESTHSPTRPRYVHCYFTMTQQQSTRTLEHAALPAQSLPSSARLHRATVSDTTVLTMRVEWYCW